MSDLHDVGQRDGWRCWLCDTAVDPEASVNSDLGPSVDNFADSKAKKGTATTVRLAHRFCNTMRGKKAPVVPWSPDLFVSDPAAISNQFTDYPRKGAARRSRDAPLKQTPSRHRIGYWTASAGWRRA